MSKAPVTKPPLGWNSYDGFGCHIYEELCLRELAAFARTYVPHGYEYFVIDSGWFAEQEVMAADGYRLPVVQYADPDHVCIDAFGIHTPAPCVFPNCFAPLTEFCRAHGIKLGLHVMRGIPRKAVEQNTPIKGTNYRARDIANTEDTCAWCSYMYGIDMLKPGAQEYLNSVMDQLSRWGVEFVKVDDVSHRPAEAEGYVKAVAHASGPICLSLSPGNDTNKRYLDTYGMAAMCRITKDLWDKQEDIDVGFAYWRSWQGLEQPGFYPDLDMIPFGELCLLKRPANFQKGSNANFCAGDTMHHICHFTEAQKETYITQRAMAASPLIIGGSLVSMDAHAIHLLTHPDMLACNQNGVMGRSVCRSVAGLEIFLTPDRRMDATGQQRYEGAEGGWIGIFNLTDALISITVTRAMLGLRRAWDEATPATYRLRNIWRGDARSLKPGEDLPLDVAPHGVVFYRFDRGG